MTNQVLTWLIAHRQIDINMAKATALRLLMITRENDLSRIITLDLPGN